MKKKEKEKRPYSAVNNFGYTLRMLFGYNAWYPIITVLSTLLSLGVAVWATYENKFFLDELESGNPSGRVLIAVAGIVGIGLLLWILQRALSHLQSFQGNCTWEKLYRLSFDTLGAADYDKLESPEYKNIYSQYVAYLSSSLKNEFYYVMQFLYSVLSAVVFGTVISSLHPLIVVGLVVMAVLYYVIKRPLAKIQQKMNLRLVANDRKFQYVTAISGDFSNAKEMRLYHMQEWIGSKAEECKREHIAVHSAIQWRAFSVGAAHNFLNLLRDGGAYIYLIVLFFNGEMTAGDFMLYFTAITSLSSTLTGFANRLNDIHKYDLQVTELRKAEKIATSRNRGRGIPIPDGKIDIEFRNVTFRYPNAQDDTIRNLSFHIKPGERVALVGMNGAGKTTLVKLLCGLYLPTEGEILLNGHPVHDYNIRDYYSLFSAVFQDISFMPISLAENIACTTDSSRIDRTRVLYAIEEAGLGKRIEALKDGIDTLYDKEVNPEATDFSGGEKQKLALARAIYLGRPVLVLDEPTSALDPIAENEMYLKFDKISKEQTSLFISHRLASTRFCDRIFHLENGRIIEEGTHAALMEKNGRYAEMFRMQSQYYKDEKEARGE